MHFDTYVIIIHIFQSVREFLTSILKYLCLFIPNLSTITNVLLIFLYFVFIDFILYYFSSVLNLNLQNWFCQFSYLTINFLSKDFLFSIVKIIIILHLCFLRFVFFVINLQVAYIYIPTIILLNFINYNFSIIMNSLFNFHIQVFFFLF